MTTRVLIINQKLVFAVTVKQALEQTGSFLVHAFTAADAAIEYLQDNAHDVALIDLAAEGPDLIRRMRMIQQNIAIIASPVQPNSKAMMQELNLQGMIDAPFSAREVIPLIEHAIELMQQTHTESTQRLADTAETNTAETEILAGDVDDFDAPLAAEDEAFEAFLHSITGVNQQEEGAPEKTERDAHVPPTLPEFSSLDSILVDEAPSEIYEPPVGDEDTPNVPTSDSQAVRQFLATRDDVKDDFDSVLGDIDPEEESARPGLPRSEMTSFDELVNSMRSESQHTPLPDRHQQFIEFILTGGMDVLLKEIEKSKTDSLEDKDSGEDSPDAQASSAFEQIAAEEPPMPALEESGTVGDLMLGVGDPSFQHVLAMMRGDDVGPGDERDSGSQLLPTEIEAAFESFFESQAKSDVEQKADMPTEPPPAEPLPARDEFSFEPKSPSEQAETMEPESEDGDNDFTAQLILATALDETSPIESFSLDDLINSIEKELSEHQPDVKPLPSWNARFKPPPKADQRYIQEPDFLPEEFPTSRYIPVVQPDKQDVVPRLDEPEVMEETPVSAHRRQPPEAPVQETPVEPVEAAAPLEDEQPVLESWDGEPPVMPPDYLPEEVWDESEPDIWDVPEDEAFADEETSISADEIEAASSVPPFLDDFMIDIDESLDEQTMMVDTPGEAESAVEYDAEIDFDLPVEPIDGLNESDARAAQVALSLTQVSLELTAEATLLTRDGNLIAMDGRLEAEDLDELRALTADDASVKADESRVRFIRLSGSGRDYMVYSRRTEADFVLTLIFAPETPLRDIRRQGKRLMQALESVPEIVEQTPTQAVVSQVEPAQEPVQRAPYAYVWILRDPNASFDPATSQMVMAGLRTQLGEQGWVIQDLLARDEYVYLLADVPGERPAYEIIRELKRRTADIAKVQDATFGISAVWADSYLVLTPGRPLQQDEIIQFINFERTL